MTKLLAEAINLQNELGLDESKLKTIEQAMRNFSADTVNVAMALIDKREKPEVIRKFIEPHGLTYDGKSKKFK